MAEIRNLTRNGETFYPLTCTDAIVNRNGSYAIDDVPTAGSNNLVKSGGVKESLLGIRIKEEGKYITDAGNISGASGYFYSYPIYVKRGYLIHVETSGSGMYCEVAKCDSSGSNIDVWITRQLIANGKTEWVVEDDGYIMVSGDMSDFKFNLYRVSADNIPVKGSENLVESGGTYQAIEDIIQDVQLTNLCSDTNFENWNPMYMTYTAENGIANCISNAHEFSRLEYDFNFKKDHIYLIYINIRTNSYNRACIYLQNYSPLIDIYKGDGWTPMVYVDKIVSDNINRVGFYANRVGVNNSVAQFTKPIIVDITDLEIRKGNTLGYYSLTINMDNMYIGENPANSNPADDYFISDIIAVKKGDVFDVNITGLSGTATIVAKCDASLNFPVEPLLKFYHNIEGDGYVQNSVTKQFVIEEDGYIVVSGVKGQTSLRYSSEALAYKYVKVVNNWKDITEPTKFYENCDNQKVYSYIIASKDSVSASYADIVCGGENDQVLINRIIQLPDCESIYFTADSLFNISAPIYTKNNLKLVSKGAKFVMCDMVTNTFTAVSGKDNLFDVNDVSDYAVGMLLYVNDEHQYNRISKILPAVKQIETTIGYNYGSGPLVVKTASNAIFVENNHDVVIDGLHIDLNVANNPIQQANPWYLQEGVQIAYSERIWVKNCKIVNGGRRGVCTTDSKYFCLLNNYFDNWYEHSIDIFCGYDYSSQEALENPMMNYGVISGNICLNNHMSGIQCHRGSGCTITGNVIKNCLHGGIRNQEFAHNNTIIGNVIEGCLNGLYLGGHDIVATGNVIKDSVTSIYIGDGSDRVVVTDNSCDGADNNAIVISSSRFSKISGNTFRNCSRLLHRYLIMTNVSYKEEYYGVSSRTLISDNQFIEDDADNMPLNILYSPEDNKYNLFIRNIIYLASTIQTPYVTSVGDIVRDNDIIQL